MSSKSHFPIKVLWLLCFALLLTDCGGAASQTTSNTTAQAGSLAVSSFSATVTGVVAGDFSGTGTYFKQNEGGLLISLVASKGPSGATITITLPAATAAGTYTAKSYIDAYDSTANKITGIGASFSVLSKTSGVDNYATVSEGTLTLQSVDPLTGSIHFKAKIESGGEVEVQGTFYELLPT